jgi:hypothetical protein
MNETTAELHQPRIARRTPRIERLTAALEWLGCCSVSLHSCSVDELIAIRDLDARGRGTIDELKTDSGELFTCARAFPCSNTTTIAGFRAGHGHDLNVVAADMAHDALLCCSQESMRGGD